MEQNKGVTVALLAQQRDRLDQIAQASLERQNELFQQSQDDPQNIAKHQLWEEQKRISREAVKEFERAQTEYLESL